MKIFFKIKFNYHIPVIQWFPHWNDILVCVCVCCMCMHKWRSENNLKQLDISFCHVVFRNWTHIIRLGHRWSHLLSQLASPDYYCYCKFCFFNNRIFWKTNTRHNLILLSKRLKKWKKRGKESGEQHAYPGLYD